MLDNIILSYFIYMVYTIFLREGIYPTYSQDPYTPSEMLKELCPETDHTLLFLYKN